MSTSSSGFTGRARKTEAFMQVIQRHLFTAERYFHIPTGIEHRFGDKAAQVHEVLYRSMGPTTDLLRYFPDSLYLDRWRRLPTWEKGREEPERLNSPAALETTGLFSFFVEYKYSDSERRSALPGVPTPQIGIIEREAWLTYKRLTSPNPKLDTYLDGQRTRIALFFAATYGPEKLYAGWEEWIAPLPDARAVRKDIARPNVRAVGFSTGSGTPWINFDLRLLKPLEKFMSEDLYWEEKETVAAVARCKNELFPPQK